MDYVPPKEFTTSNNNLSRNFGTRADIVMNYQLAGPISFEADTVISLSNVIRMFCASAMHPGYRAVSVSQLFVFPDPFYFVSVFPAGC